ncbi:MAG: GAF domain-containing protein [Pseudomonadota bacterium]
MRYDAVSFTLARSRALAMSMGRADLESALSPLTGCAHDVLGDAEAASRPGALKTGERDYRVAGVFLITPDRRYNMLVASQGFPPEQRRLAIPIDWNHPGEVVRTQSSILLENTDTHAEFKQFLKSSRMGSSVYAPIMTADGMIGQIVAAAQARWTYDATDLARLERLGYDAARIWTATAGAHWLAADYPAPDIWRAQDHV